MKLNLMTAKGTYVLDSVSDEETISDVMKRHGIPTSSVFFTDENSHFVSLAEQTKRFNNIYAWAMRNVDYGIYLNDVSIRRMQDSIAESYFGASGERTLTQFTEDELLSHLVKNVKKVIDQAVKVTNSQKFIFALSPGGDGRALTEALSKSVEGTDIEIVAVITCTGFEDENEHKSEAVKLAKKWGFSYEVVTEQMASEILGYSKSLGQIASEFHKLSSRSEPEVLLSYWVQEINHYIAKQRNINNIIFGYNMEDVLGEVVYNFMFGVEQIHRFPVKKQGDFYYCAPLYRIPKKLLDSFDINNSFRNYRLRMRPNSSTRSSIFALMYYLMEYHPDFVETLLEGGDSKPDNAIFDIEKWLMSFQ